MPEAVKAARAWMHQSTRRAEGAAIVHSVLVGVLCGLLAIVQSISYGSLLLPVGGAAFVAVAIGMALFSSTAIAIITPLISSTRSVVSVTQGVPIVALASVLGPIAAQTGTAPAAARLATIIVAAALSTFLIGVVALALGAFRLGRFIRFAPLPVVGGFLAGSGWLILHGGLQLVVGPAILQDPFVLAGEGVVFGKIAAAIVFIAVMAAVGRRANVRLALPAVVVGAIVLFNLVVRVAGVPADLLHQTGWLLALPEKGSLWPPMTPSDLALVDRRALVAGAISLPSVAILTVLALLMNATGIELQFRRDADLDRELRSVGYANLVAGIGGGLPGYHSVSLTLLASRLGARGVAVGLSVGAVCLAGLLYGGALLAAVPTPIMGAMLAWIGGELIGEWLVGSYRRLPLREYLVVILIFCAIVVSGFTWGLLVGMAASIVLFVVEYGRVDIVRYFLTGQDYQTSGDASGERLDALRQHGGAILMVRLQGFLFFGTADRLRKRIHARITQEGRSRVRFVLADFGRVTGLDSSTVLSFIRLGQTAEADGFVLVLTGLSKMVKETMLRAGLAHGGGTAIRLEPTFDLGLEWCENALLGSVAPAPSTGDTPFIERLACTLASRSAAEALLARLERVEVASGIALIEQGAPSDDIFFIERGRAVVEVATEHRLGAKASEGETKISEPARIRLAALGAGAIVGEIAFYLDAPRTASIMAEGPLVAWRLRRTAIDELKRTDPQTVATLHQSMATMLADRLASTDKLLRLLAD